MTLIRTTIKALAENQEVEYADAQGLVKFLAAKRIAKEVGIAKSAGKGKGSTIWELPANLTLNLATAVADVPAMQPAEVAPAVVEPTEVGVSGFEKLDAPQEVVTQPVEVAPAKEIAGDPKEETNVPN
jgi:hypothetical protein